MPESPDTGSLARVLRGALLTSEPRAKAMAARRVARDWRAGRLDFVFDVAMPDTPGRPLAPELLPPNRMPKRGKGGSDRARIALWHALAHIEFVAIDLALDMAGRFAAAIALRLGETAARGFVSDFLRVAADEAMHFALIDRHLATLGSHYGALPAHDGLWDAARDTSHDVAARLAVVPMVLEARGLDVTPPMIARLSTAGDARGTRILSRILNDEIAHVAVGARHFAALCAADGQCAESSWKLLVARHFRGTIKPPFNDSARQRAGLSRDAYNALA